MPHTADTRNAAREREAGLSKDTTDSNDSLPAHSFVTFVVFV